MRRESRLSTADEAIWSNRRPESGPRSCGRRMKDDAQSLRISLNHDFAGSPIRPDGWLTRVRSQAAWGRIVLVLRSDWELTKRRRQPRCEGDSRDGDDQASNRSAREKGGRLMRHVF